MLFWELFMLFIESEDINDNYHVNYNYLPMICSWILLFISEILPFINTVRSNGILELFGNIISNLIKNKINLEKPDWIPLKQNEQKIDISLNEIDTITLNFKKKSN